jgi:septum site-determining protein MinC
MALSSIVEFKGTKDGLVLLFLERRPIENVLEDITRKVAGKEAFFKGARIVGVEGLILGEDEKKAICGLFEETFKIEVSSLERYEKKVFVKMESSAEEQMKSTETSTGVFEGLEEGITKFVKGTLRSGKSIEFEGNIVILGDVNPGAEVIAYGNIVVMGTLRGVVHAGANGNDSAYVVANRLLTKQIRISRLITSSEDDTDKGASVPEMACIKNDSIVIGSYL